MSGNIYEQHLERTQANFVALSPVSFVERSAEVFGDLPAVIHGARRFNWRETRERSARRPRVAASSEMRNASPAPSHANAWSG